jgi:hypothetical protein
MSAPTDSQDNITLFTESGPSPNLIARVATTIFQKNILDSIRVQWDSSIPVEIPSDSLDLYAETFNSSQSLVQTLSTSYRPDEISDPDAALHVVEDADHLLVLSCFLKLLSRYDKIFAVWLGLLEATTKIQNTFNLVLRDIILQLKPPISVGMFMAPSCYVAQIQFILELCGNMFQNSSQSLDNVVVKLKGRSPLTGVPAIPHVSDTVLALVVSREISVRTRKEDVLQRLMDQDVRGHLEVLLLS